METLIAVAEDGARRKLDQLCRHYPKTWAVIPEVLLTDLGLTCSSNLRDLRLIAQLLLTICCSGFLISELPFTIARHSFR